jgi:hypothetical protein
MVTLRYAIQGCDASALTLPKVAKRTVCLGVQKVSGRFSCPASPGPTANRPSLLSGNGSQPIRQLSESPP